MNFPINNDNGEGNRGVLPLCSHHERYLTRKLCTYENLEPSLYNLAINLDLSKTRGQWEERLPNAFIWFLIQYSSWPLHKTRIRSPTPQKFCRNSEHSSNICKHVEGFAAFAALGFFGDDHGEVSWLRSLIFKQFGDKWRFELYSDYYRTTNENAQALVLNIMQPTKKYHQKQKCKMFPFQRKHFAQPGTHYSTNTDQLLLLLNCAQLEVICFEVIFPPLRVSSSTQFVDTGQSMV